MELCDLFISLSAGDWFVTLRETLNAQAFFEWFVDNASYLFVFTFMVIESSFVPFPSEVVVPPAAYLACTTRGDMNIFLVVLVATAGALTGALINYVLSRTLGRTVVYSFAGTRLAHACLIDRAKVDKAERYFDRHGAISTLIGRLIPVIRQFISIPAGLAKMNVGIFCLYTSIGAMIWNIILALMGWILARNVAPGQLFEAVEKYNSYLTYGGLALLAVCVAYLIWKAAKKPKND